MIAAEAPKHCTLCPRLVAYREDLRRKHPDWWGGAVASFGEPRARLLVLGLAPGARGAHRTGRPFTGDDSGTMLFAALERFGFTNGRFESHPDDGLVLSDCMITNAVRCVPPGNRPTGAEVNACRDFLIARIAALPQLSAILCLGRVAHDSLIRGLGARLAAHPFGHGAQHDVAGYRVFASYHCSRYNTNTGRLTPAMFDAVFSGINAFLKGENPA